MIFTDLSESDRIDISKLTEVNKFMAHYCWKCGQYLANEKFSGKGHARHICKKCMGEEHAHRREVLKQKRERGEIPPIEQKPVSHDIIEYVENEIIPRYSNFDKAHQENHVRMVIEQSLRLAAHTPTMSLDMVYVIAAFHDLGLINGRENHHKDSRRILEADEFVKAHFNRKQIVTMGRAVEDHRASNQKKPRNGYGLIVAEADRLIDAETIIRRTIQYGMANYPELDIEGHRTRTFQHLTEKYGPKGYLKVWIPWSDNAKNLKRLHAMLSDKTKLNEIFERIFAEETEHDNHNRHTDTENQNA